MDPDLALSIGMVLGVFSVPWLISAYSEGLPPRLGALTLVASAGLILWAVLNTPGGYDWRDLPEVLIRVIARYIA